ncbi:MAG: tripartite tricarboxylate transporter substrate binding protein [Burkholderiales bacterium]|nr:tripartite tricarboxylate transporter substrate binding protein [Burkholderiales bacterium]
MVATSLAESDNPSLTDRGTPEKKLAGRALKLDRVSTAIDRGAAGKGGSVAKLWKTIALLWGCAVVGFAAGADRYPARPIQLIVGFAPGGPTDILARAVANSLSHTLGQQIVVVNRPGAGSNIAAEMVARGTPDGYTILMGSSANAVNVTLYSKLGFDFPRDFAPVSLVGTAPLVLVIAPSLPAATVKEFVALLKARPGRINYGSGGYGSSMHLAAEVFRAATGVNLVHVPYGGAAPAVQALLAGEVQFLFCPIPNALPFARQDRVRLLAVSTGKRSALIPEVPTMSEAGVPRYDVSPWWGLFAPAHTPGAAVKILAKAVEAVANDPGYKKQLDTLGAQPLFSAPEPFSRYVTEEVTRWAQVVRASGAKVD